MYAKKASWTIHLEGDDVDSISLVELIDGLDKKVKITCAHVNVNYSPEKEVKEERHESEAHRTHRTGSSIIPVVQGGSAKK